MDFYDELIMKHKDAAERLAIICRAKDRELDAVKRERDNAVLLISYLP